jgi:tetratricopeptide (TPR) repeat protein
VGLHRHVFPLLALAASLAVATLTLAPGLAEAQPQGAVSAERLEQSRKFMEEGQGLYVQKKYEEAAEAFHKAYTTQPFAAFLFNEGVAQEKAGQIDKALDTFRRYLAADASAPDADSVKARIQRLEGEKTRAPGTPTVDRPTETTRSLLLIETDPVGAPTQVWQKVDPAAAAFAPGTANKGWKLMSSGPTPLAATLDAGQFHVFVERWLSYNRSETDLRVEAGRVHQFKANLSQGAFMSFLKVVSEVDGAILHLDDPPPFKKKRWGFAPHGELIATGEHTLWVEAPGYETFTTTFTVEPGQQKQINAALERVSYGYLDIDATAPSFRVLLDAEEQGTGRGEALRVKAEKGYHVLRVEAEGKKPYQEEIQVAPGQTRAIHVSLINRYSRGTAWGAAATSAILLGAGIYLGVRSNHLHDDLVSDRRGGLLGPDDKRKDDGRLLSIGADSCLGAGVLVAGLALYEFVRDPLPPSGARVEDPEDLPVDSSPRRRASFRWPANFQIMPTVAQGQGGIMLGGSF